jgi:predicted TPR repeat methyltransferase
MNYQLAYALGFHPWEDAATDPPFVAKAAQMFQREEQARQPPYGRALDLGTGSGIWGIELAKRSSRKPCVALVTGSVARAST